MAAAVAPLILNVDDYEPARYAVTRVLQQAEFRVAEAGTGAEALELARTQHPDLILLDVNLPDITGFEVCQRMKADPATARIPVVHVSATSAQTADRARGLDFGAESYLIHPVEPEVLVATINAALRAHRAEETARLLAQQWQATFDALGHGIALVDAGGRLLRWNRALERLAGREPRQGQCLDELWSARAAETQKTVFERAVETGQRQDEVVESDDCYLEMTADPMSDEARRITGAVCTVDDITARMRLERQFREAQKFESIGQLAAGVAHEFNNLLTAVLGNASLMLADLPPQHQFSDPLEEIIKASNRAARLTQQLLAYSGRTQYTMRLVDVARLVGDMGNLLRASLPRTVELEFDLAGGLSPVHADAVQLQQVIMNLAINAGEAIAESPGRVTVRARSVDAWVVLEVEDTGPGIPPEIRPHMFDPFFTTKFMGRGLGLAAVAGIVRAHNGAIEALSGPGGGTVLRVSLPAAHIPRPAPVEKPLILIADDEAMVRRVAKAALEGRGYRVLLAEDGLDAVEVVRNHAHELGAVLLDLTMPRMSGEEAMAEIARLAPGLKVIASSGYSQAEAARRFAPGALAGFLQKPYTVRQLAEKIESVL